MGSVTVPFLEQFGFLLRILLGILDILLTCTEISFGIITFFSDNDNTTNYENGANEASTW